MKIDEKRVYEVMNRSLFTVLEDSNIEEILDIMINNKISAVIVTAKNGEFLGLISKTDILTGLKKYGAELLNKTAEDLLNPKPFTIEGNATIKEAAQKKCLLTKFTDF